MSEQERTEREAGQPVELLPCPRCGASDRWVQVHGMTFCAHCRFWYEGYGQVPQFDERRAPEQPPSSLSRPLEICEEIEHELTVRDACGSEICY